MAKVVVAHSAQEVQQAVQELAQEVKNATTTALQAAVDKTAKETAKEIREAAPRRSGVYASKWTHRKTDGRVGVYGREVYQSKKPSLTHLLENGHEIKGAKRFRKNKTRTDAFPHITPDDITEERFERNLLKKIDKELDKV